MKDWTKIAASVGALVVAVIRQDPVAIGTAVLAIVNLFLHPPTPAGLGFSPRQ